MLFLLAEIDFVLIVAERVQELPPVLFGMALAAGVLWSAVGLLIVDEDEYEDGQ